MIWLVLLGLLLWCPPARAAAVDDWPCVTCHPSRDRAAFDLLREDRTVILGDEAAQERVCRSCHNGSVVDSRRILARGSQHPSGVAAARPPPEPFALYGGRIECGTCHSPHAGGEAGRRWLRVLPRGNEPCASCHPGRADRHLGMELSPEARERISALGGRTEGDTVVCATCHRLHGASGRALLVAPYGDREDGLCRVCHARLPAPPSHQKAGCGSCHRPHRSEPLLAEGRPCLTCHPDTQTPSDHPAASPVCTDCHAVHNPVRPEGSPKGLLRMPTDRNLLCGSCHAAEGAGPHGRAVPVAADPKSLARRGMGLDAGGNLVCTTCHRAHGAAVAPLLVGSPGVRCLYCHPGQNPFVPANTGAHPVAVPLPGGRVLGCSTCHAAHRAKAGPADCQGCHPMAEGGRGHGGRPGCGACHDIHGTGAPAARCAGCHDEGQVHLGVASEARPGLPVFGGTGRPAPEGEVGCPTCHDPHRPGAPVRGGQRACLGCHPDKREATRAPHGGVSGCFSCHPGHGDEESRPAEDRCRACHGPDTVSLAAHTPKGAPAWKGLGERLPLFDRAGRRNPFGFMTCPTCHDVHRPDGFRMEPRDPPRLCLTCHGDKASLLGSPHDPRSGGAGAACDVCHPQHCREGEPPLWSLRAEATGTWNDRKCTGCHGPSSGGPWPHTGPRSHPVDVVVPESMEAGDLPLYDPLGGRVGRVLACTTCHDLHGAWNREGERIPWFLRMPPADGALCQQCHPAEAAVRGTAHDVRTDPPDPLGPCGPCHRTHGAVDRALWALEPAAGDYAPNRLCRSCHGQEGPLPGERPLLQHHMKDAEPLRTPRGTIYLQRPMLLTDTWALKTGEEPLIPLYDRQGNAGPSGNLQCVSCHDPHRWSPFGSFVKPGFGALGPNVVTRFLRLRDPQQAARSVCAVCHPKDAPERYLKYHRAWTDVGAEFR
ncbi:cytochrome c3 family protein [Deferrisoma camini]|uniref:cytochrome c3 family protein n=1 Tax=Deferrisoma camini TaxID=1035120 RepID=UPI00046CCCB3|nr:cytochrome c3 family protein [Deferrisoma camini]